MDIKFVLETLEYHKGQIEGLENNLCEELKNKSQEFIKSIVNNSGLSIEEKVEVLTK